MGLSGAVRWWEEWQLRMLVLGSLTIQLFLAAFACFRKIHIRPLYRFFIWLSYLGSDALAIYALATLFNRQEKLQYHSLNGSNVLEVLWAPILLIHLGGPSSISAFNIEDNELWRRHILTTMAQVTVAVYVFCKSWSSSADKRLLAAAVILFILAVFNCVFKPLVLKRGSFNSIVCNFRPAPWTETSTEREIELEEYIQEARACVQDPTLGLEVVQDPTLGSGHLLTRKPLPIPDKLFVDYAYAYRDRLTNLRLFQLRDKASTYEDLRGRLSETFDRIYSKLLKGPNENEETTRLRWYRRTCGSLIIFFRLLLPVVPIVLFHSSHKEAYRGTDIKVTFLLLYLTYFFETLPVFIMSSMEHIDFSYGVAQHSLLHFLACSRRQKRLAGIAELFGCKSLLATCFGLRPCYSSKHITFLVCEHVAAGWMNHITDVESYWRFSDTRGHWALERNGTSDRMLWSIQKPFDESIILWHVATDLCFYIKGTSPDSQRGRLCKQISNYMMHLLFNNPEMLLPGSRSNLFTVAYDELEAILQGEGDDVSLLDEKGLTPRIIDKLESAKGIVIIPEAWLLAQELMQLDDEKMWEVIKGVWIEMLCFSAGRCRGYLHAKSLGSGGEFLTLVSLLLSYAGLETYADRQQRLQLRLPKQERVEIAKQRIREAETKQATSVSLTPHGMVPVKEEEDPASPSASQFNQEGNTAPNPEIKIVVSL